MNTNDNIEYKLPLEKVWQESSGEVSSRTFLERLRLEERIEASRKKASMVRTVLYTAAVAASLAVVSLLTFSLTRNSFDTPSLSGTHNLVAGSGQTSSITLEDGTVVHLNAGSSLLYPESFKKGSRIVYLSGEGNFYVATDPSRPFIVKTAYMDVQALGTVFCVQSFVGDRQMRATLKEGKVMVSVPSVGEQPYYLNPDDQLVFSPSENTVSLAKVDAARVLGWEEGYLTFTNASFQEIVSVLQRRFNVSIVYDFGKTQNNALNMRFQPDESLEDVLNVLSLLIPGSRFTIEENRVYWHF